jgi:cyclase
MNRRSIFTVASLGFFLSLVTTAHSADELPLDALLKKFGWNVETTGIRTEKVGEGLFVLFGVGGNIAVSVGEDGVLIVDDQFPELMPKIKAAIASLGGKKIDFAINTHWHFDHAEGNQVLGPDGTWIVSQANSRAMMQGEHLVNGVIFKYRQKPYPAAALPALTFSDTMQFHFNGGQIDLEHYGPAHTTGDTAVYFRQHNAVHLGDVFNNAGYPFIDVDNGGDLQGVIAFCEAALAELKPGAIVIPGHGPVARYDNLVAYIAMLKDIRAKIAPMVEKGAPLAEVVAAKPTAAFDSKFGDPTILVDRAYWSLVKAKAAQR